MFAILVKDRIHGSVHCHAFQCAAQMASSIADAMAKAFVAYQLKSSSDPFKAAGGRLKAPKALFNRQVHRRTLTAIHAIGAGQFGQVYKAEHVPDEGKHAGKRRLRAVKMLRGGASTADRDEFAREAEVMLKMDHPSVIRMVGVCVQQAPWLMVLEFLEYGDLRSVLEACKAKAVKLHPAEQLKILGDIAGGMAYMASQRLVHIDLAARNCLLGRDNVVKVADFGMTTELVDGEDTRFEDCHGIANLKINQRSCC